MNIILDPFKKFKNFGYQTINDNLGLIPGWLNNSQFTEVNAKVTLMAFYKFGMNEIEDVNISKDGIWSYKGDPDLYPIAKIEREEEIIYQYEYGLVAIIDKNGNSFATRMD